MPAANPLGRYALGSRDPLRYNADGSLDLRVSHAPPPPEEQANWLPLPPAGPVSVLLRVYTPEPALLDGSWTPPPALRDAPPEETPEAAEKTAP
jgi:hypothetical protein